MSLLSQTFVLYVVVGLGVAVAVYLSAANASRSTQCLRVSLALVAWPVFLPVLLTPRQRSEPVESLTKTQPVPVDEMTTAIGQVDAELEAALASLDGWAEDVLARETSRIHELRTAWTAQAERIREMDRVLALPEHADALVGQDSNPVDPYLDPSVDGTATTSGLTGTPSPAHRLRSSRLARRQNIARLRRIRQRAHEDLMGTLAWVRELVTMIHLAKFTGAPASRAEELVAQIAAAVEGLSELTWQEESAVPIPQPAYQTASPETRSRQAVAE
jgi:hypothetical protein